MNAPHPDWIVPDWPAPPGVRAFVTTRAGGVSPAPYDSLNLGRRTADADDNTARNRGILRAALPSDPVWLNQVHGAAVVEAGPAAQDASADASFTAHPGVVCAVMTADCMPVLFASRDGSRVAAAHAGWRGLAGGVLEATAAALAVPGPGLIAWLGPAIGPDHFEVGEDVWQAFCAGDAAAATAFRPYPGRPGKWLCDLYALARRRLAALGIESFGGGACTVADPRFFSHRRDRGLTGRMAAVVWMAPAAGT
jgi:YfiH family protein